MLLVEVSNETIKSIFQAIQEVVKGVFGDDRATNCLAILNCIMIIPV